jgi:hypothetical protein
MICLAEVKTQVVVSQEVTSFRYFGDQECGLRKPAAPVFRIEGGGNRVLRNISKCVILHDAKTRKFTVLNIFS